MENQVEEKVTNHKELVKGHRYNVIKTDPNTNEVQVDTDNVFFTGMKITKTAMFNTDARSTGLSIEIDASDMRKNHVAVIHVPHDYNTRIRVRNSQAMRWHATDTGDWAGLHCHMYVWMDDNPKASFEEYERFGKMLGINTYSEEAYYEK